MRPAPNPPVTLAFQPQTLPERLRFALVGRPLLQRALREVASLPPDLTPATRRKVQQDVARRILRHLRARLVARGLEHARGGPFLVVALHEGILDVLALLALPLPLRFVARDEIFAWPGVGPAITRLGHVSINPESGAAGYRRLLGQAREVTRGGESLVVFPQGTVLGLETDFQRGAFLLARHLGLPILPVVLTGAHRLWEHPFSPVLRYGQAVGLRVLPPVSRSEVQRTPPDLVRVRLRRLMKGAALEGDLPPPRNYDPERDGYWDGFRFDIDPDFADLHRAVLAHRQQELGDSA